MSHLDYRFGKYRYVSSESYGKMPFHISMAGVDRCAPRYYLKRSPSPISVAGFTLKGCGIVVQNGKTAEAKEGSLFLVNVTDAHEYYPKADWEFCWVNIEGEYWREILEKYGLEKQVVFADFEQGNEFLSWVHHITEDRMDLDTWQIGMQGFLLKMILHLYKAQAFRNEQSLAAGIKREFEKYGNAGLTQEEVCKKIGLTARHAQRVFKQEYGLSIHQYLSEKKMQQAKALLLNTNSSIKQIAEENGFGNEKYFSAFFQKNEGISPTQYRLQSGRKHGEWKQEPESGVVLLAEECI